MDTPLQVAGGRRQPAAARPAAPIPCNIPKPKYDPLDVRLKLSLSATQHAWLKAEAARAGLSTSSYARVCLDCAGGVLEALEASPSFVRNSDSGGPKCVQLRIGRRLESTLVSRASALGMPLARYARGIVLAQRIASPEDSTEGSPHPAIEPVPVVFRDTPGGDKDVAEAVRGLGNQVRRLGYNLDNCLYALNTIKKRKGLRQAKVESLLETTNARLARAMDMRRDLDRAYEAVEKAVLRRARKDMD